MELLFVMLVLPLVGALMLLFDWHRKSGMDSQARQFGRRMLSLLGCLALLQAAVVGTLLVRGLLAEGGVGSAGLLKALLRSIVAGVVAYAGISALRVGRHEERDDLDLAAQVRRARESEHLWAAELLLAGLPLVVPATMVMLVGAGVLGVYEVVSSFGRSVRTSRVLWTLALAASDGRSFVEELEFAALYERNARWRRRFKKLARDLSNGTSLATALAAQPGFIPRHLLTAIQTAEESGRLAEVLPELAVRNSQHLDQEEMNTHLCSLALSTWIVGLVLILTASFVCYWIVPKLKEILADFGMQTPAATDRFVGVAELLMLHWYIAFPLLSLPVLLLVGLHQMTLASAQGRAGLLVRFFPRLEATTVLRTLADAARCGTPLDHTLELMSHLHPLEQQRGRLARAQSRIGLGDPVGTALKDEGFLNASECHALQAAERLGQLPWTMQALAGNLDRRRIEQFQWILEFSRPLLVLLMAGLVLFFCVSIMSPLADLIGELS